MAKLSDMVAPFDQINAQYNAPFAGLAASTLRQAQPFEGLGDYVNEIYENKRKREHENNLLEKQIKHNKEMSEMQNKFNKDNAKLNLGLQYKLMGGQQTPDDMSPYDIATAMYSMNTLNPSRQPSQNSPSLQGLGDIDTLPTGIIPVNSVYGNRYYQENNPPLNENGRLSLKDLPKAAKVYPYLNMTKAGKDFLNRLEQAIVTNRENINALQPFADELYSGKIPLTAPLTNSSSNVVTLPKTGTEELLQHSAKTSGRKTPDILDSLTEYVSSFTNPSADAKEKVAEFYGRDTPVRVADSSIWDYVSGPFRARDRGNAADDYIEKYKNTIVDMERLGLRRFEPDEENNQVLNKYRSNLSRDLGVRNPLSIIPLIDNRGDLYFLSNNAIYRMINENTFQEVINNNK